MADWEGSEQTTTRLFPCPSPETIRLQNQLNGLLFRYQLSRFVGKPTVTWIFDVNALLVESSLILLQSGSFFQAGKAPLESLISTIGHPKFHWLCHQLPETASASPTKTCHTLPSGADSKAKLSRGLDLYTPQLPPFELMHQQQSDISHNHHRWTLSSPAAISSSVQFSQLEKEKLKSITGLSRQII